ncbi:hypothetical protein [Vibrio diazotrophicus]|uniref:hypothetical protein n=1 Tax=Vibrio diazotrophicus TaxID=685 RepID=UPI000C9E0E9E|nr:hypothetical protein [Vibrio diazotrophicus]PNH81347.1 hypothetical protein C1N27_07325 [Vibrio diazotrophicus]
MTHTEIINDLDWDYIRYYSKLLINGDMPRATLNSKTCKNKDNPVLCLQNDICLAIDKRLKQEEKEQC